jgi:predicted peptidase
MHRSVLCLFALINALLGATINDFAAGSMTYNGTTVVYRLYSPADIVAGQRYPLIVALHGAGDRGNNNTAQLRYGFMNLVGESEQRVRPCFVFAPQCPVNHFWATGGWERGVYEQSTSPTGALSTTVHLLDSLVAVLPMDTNRLYVTGISMGGMGTWDLITRYPERFAAAVPVCGAVDTAKLIPLAALPLWTYHGSADDIIPPLGTRTAMRKFADMGQAVVYPRCGATAPSPCAPLSAAALQVELPNAHKIYTEFAGAGHNVWDNAYGDTMMLRWMFLQTRKTTNTIRTPGEYSAQITAYNPAMYTVTGKRVKTESAAVYPRLYIMQNRQPGLRVFSKE